MRYQEWMLSLLLAGAAAGAMMILTPEGPSKKIVTALSAALLWMTFLSLFGVRMPEVREIRYERYREEAEKEMKASETDLRNGIFRKMREIAAEKAAEKASALGLDAEISFEAAYDDQAGYRLESAVIRYARPPEEDAAAAFKRWLAEEMGIPIRKQKHIF